MRKESAEDIVSANWNDAVASVLTRAAVLPSDTVTSGLPMMQAISLFASLRRRRPP